MKHCKRLAFALLILAFILPVLGYVLADTGPRRFPERGTLPKVQDVIEEARKLRGTPYDLLMGKHGNIGARLGAIVCSDVPNLAYGRAGYSMERMLAEEFSRNPAAFDTRNGNTPKNPFFHRRARNLFAYFQSTNGWFPPDTRPLPGDLVFYRKHPSGRITHVALVTKRTETGYRILESAPRLIVAMEVDGRSPIRAGCIPAGFGRMYPAPGETAPPDA